LGFVGRKKKKKKKKKKRRRKKKKKNYFPHDTTNLSHMFCATRPSDYSMLSLKAFLHKRFTKSSLGTGNYIMKEI
jgi:hypothetical protein